MTPAPRLDGKTILITGATSGIGLATARELHDRGANLLLVGRDYRKLADVQSSLGTDRVDTARADLSLVRDVDRLADDLLRSLDRLDVLLNNAGGMATRRHLTAEGLERTFATNHLAYFHLTNRLLPLLKASAPSRIVNVASDAHFWAKSLDFDDLQGEKNPSGMAAYGRSKLLNILFTRELARRLEGSGVTANALHPGVVRTGIFPGGPVGRLAAAIIGISPERGAQTSVYLATSPEVEGVSGRYFDRCKEHRASAVALDDDLARRAWDVSELLINSILTPSRATTP